MIELEATEVENKPVADAAGKAAEPAAAATTPDAPPSQPAPASEPPAAEQGPPPEPPPAAATADAPGSAEPRKTSTAWRLIGAGVAVLAAVLIALLGANFAAGYLGASALEARLARLEQQLREVARAVPRRPRRRSPPARRACRAGSRGSRPRSPIRARARSIPRSPTASPSSKARSRRWPRPSAILGRRSDDIGVTAREARARVDTLAAALAELSQKVTRLGAPAVERRELEALTSRIAAIERGEKAVEAELAKRSRQRRPLAAARGGGRDALKPRSSAASRSPPSLPPPRRSAPDAKALAPLEPFAATGVPTAARWRANFPRWRQRSIRPPARPPREGGILDRLQANAEKLVRVRPVEEIAGDDPAAVVAAPRSRRRTRISPARSPSSRSCRPPRGRRPRPGSARRRRAPPPRGQPPLRRRALAALGK